MARPVVRNERWLVAGAAALVLAGGITYVATKGPVTTEHLAAQQLVSKPTPPAAVTVTPADGDSAVTGQYGPGSASWSTGWGLKPATAYTVTAVARNSKGAETTEVTHFTTKSAARTLQISSITPNPGETVGV